MREITKNVEFEVDGELRKFYIKKMNAYDGMYLLKVVSEKVMPLLQAAVKFNVENEDEEKDNFTVNINMIANQLPEMFASLSQEELKKLTILCLKTVQMSLPAGYQQVVDERGNFGVEELEYNVMACLRLVYEVVALNCSDFFEESGLTSLLGRKIGSRQEPKT